MYTTIYTTLRYYSHLSVPEEPGTRYCHCNTGIDKRETPKPEMISVIFTGLGVERPDFSTINRLNTEE